MIDNLTTNINHESMSYYAFDNNQNLMKRHKIKCIETHFFIIKIKYTLIPDLF